MATDRRQTDADRPGGGGGKVFGIGLSKTGTTSLAKALRVLGYRVVDFPNDMAEIEAVDAATDSSVAVAFQDLDRRFPGSRFVYTWRERDAWLGSCAKMWARRKALYDRSEVISRVHRTLYGGTDFDAARFAAAWERHDQAVRSHFADRPADLLSIDLTAEAAPWQTLCGFLGRAVPADTPFPHSNRSDAIDGLLARLSLRLPDPTPEKLAALGAIPLAYARELLARPVAERETLAVGFDPDLDEGWELPLMLREMVRLLGSPQPVCVLLALTPKQLQRLVFWDQEN